MFRKELHFLIRSHCFSPENRSALSIAGYATIWIEGTQISSKTRWSDGSNYVSDIVRS